MFQVVRHCQEKRDASEPWYELGNLASLCLKVSHGVKEWNLTEVAPVAVSSRVDSEWPRTARNVWMFSYLEPSRDFKNDWTHIFRSLLGRKCLDLLECTSPPLLSGGFCLPNQRPEHPLDDGQIIHMLKRNRDFIDPHYFADRTHFADERL
jgi:hypothetical protein